MTDLPILYSFRRCPYAMRGRMGLTLGGKTVRLRELILRDKPQGMLEASPKGTVPVLILEDGTVIDESLDVIAWALKGHPDEDRLWGGAEREALCALIEENDGPFKHHLDRYKYATRYEDVDEAEHRMAGAAFLSKLNDQLTAQGQLFGAEPTVADYAIFPFVRQFRIPDPDWFDAQAWPALHPWLEGHVTSDLFISVMKKYKLWNDTGEETVFGG